MHEHGMMDLGDGEPRFPQRTKLDRLIGLRWQNPYLAIEQWPDSTISVLVSSGAAVDIVVPDSAQMVRVSYVGNIILSRNGTARPPTSDPEARTANYGEANPPPVWRFCYGIKSLSAYAVNSDAYVTFSFARQQ
jgi:hypothetical protein